MIPIQLDAETQAAVDAAGAAGDELLVVPRLDGRYAAIGVTAVIDQVGRLPSGEPAVVVRGLRRAQIGSGVPGPGAALWVEATEVEPVEETRRDRELASQYKSLVISVLQRRSAWQVIDAVQRMDDEPGRAAR